MPCFIPAENMETLQAKILKINRKAVKLHCSPIVLTVLGTKKVETKDDLLGVVYTRTLYECEVSGESPRINGWKLIATLAHQPNGEMIVREVPGETCPVKYRTADIHCDHCNFIRKRSLLCVLENTEGEHKQVGRSCVADFLGSQDPKHILAYSELLFDSVEMMEESSRCGGGQFGIPIGKYVAVVASLVRQEGFIPKSQATLSRAATSVLAWTACLDKKPDLKILPEDVERAEAAVDWAASITDASNNYLHSLSVACRQGFVTYSNSGYVASVISAHMRFLGDEIKSKKPVRISQHVGEVGKRQDFANLTVVRISGYDTQFGYKTVVVMNDESGNVIVWKTTGNSDWAEVGVVVTICATVSKHTEYNNVNQTEVQRAVVRD